MRQPSILSAGIAALTIASIGVPILAQDCPPIDGVAGLLQPGRVLVLGEVHGTAESPAFVLGLSCHAAAAGLKIIVGLEQMPAGRGEVNRFLESAGGIEDRERLLAGSMWQAGYQDGRASWAMFELIDGLRRQRSREASLSVVLFDASGAAGGQERERAMARNLRSSGQMMQLVRREARELGPPIEGG